MHLTRYFCEFGQEDKVSRNGYFIIPEEQWEKALWIGNKEIFPKPWKYYASAKSVVLLGPPRQGKTSEFLYQCSKISNGFFLSLGKIPPSFGLDSFEDALENRAEWNAWLSESENGEIFIDALDEAKLTARKMIQNVTSWLRKLGEPTLRRLRIHLSCRAADWNRADQDDWLNLFRFLGEEKEKLVVVLALLDLDQLQYNEYCKANRVDPEQLFNDLPVRAQRFVARPQTLKMIVEDYRKSARPPEKIIDLYERVILRRLGEENPEYNRAGYILPTLTKRGIAELYAIVSILSDRPLITDEKAEADKAVPFGLTAYGGQAEELTFNSGLFRSSFRGQYLFDDPELKDYLGACYLKEQIDKDVISAQRVFNLFLAYPHDEEPVPKLRGMMVWLCALNPSFRQITIGINPGVLLEDFPGELNSQNKLAIWDWLESKYGDRGFFEESRRWEEGCKVLACSEIISRLQKCLGNSSYGRDIRILALEVTLAGNLTELGAIIEQSCMNVNDDHHYLIRASQVLSTIAPERSEVLRIWLKLKPEDDPRNYLLGSALQALWPKFISIEDVVTCLRPAYRAEGSSDGLSFFLYELPSKLDPEERKLVISSMARDLKSLFKKDYPAGKEPLYSLTHASYIIYFLVPQIEAWGADTAHLPELEEWISITFRARDERGLFLHDPSDKLAKILEADKNFRHALAVRYIERIYQEKGEEFNPQKYWGTPYQTIKGEDLLLWQETLVVWLGQAPCLAEVVFYQLLIAWDRADNPPYIINWLEELSVRDKLINQLWSQYNHCKLPDEEHYWQRKSFQRKEEQRTRHQERVQALLKKKEEICAGNPYLLDHLLRISIFNNKSIVEEYGPEIDLAYKIGLITYWKEKTLPPLDEYYGTNKFPNAIFFILEAVKFWKHEREESWADLSDQMCRAALLAGLSNLNQLPEWYVELAQFKVDTFLKIAFEALKIEAQSSNDYPSLARNLKHNHSVKIFREIALNFLKQNPDVRSQVALPLAEAQSVDIPFQGAIEFLWEMGLRRMEEGDQITGLSILSLVWRYQSEVVWNWLNKNFLIDKGKRGELFQTWINTIINMHIPGTSSWPDWVTAQALISILPDFFANFPPATDPTIEEFNKNIPAITRRWDLGHIRNDALAKIAESGSPEAGEFLTSWSSDSNRMHYRDHILLYLDRWHQACAQKGWQPLPPKAILSLFSKEDRILEPPPESGRFKLVIRGLIRGIPYLGEAIDAAIFGQQ